jgi:hypothetical protein
MTPHKTLRANLPPVARDDAALGPCSPGWRRPRAAPLELTPPRGAARTLPLGGDVNG